MKYCVYCGATLIARGVTSFECSGCGHHHYLNPKATCGIIIMTGEAEVLLSRRASDPYKGELDIIGGFVDVDETIEAALAREVKEELGVEMTDAFEEVRYLTSIDGRYPWEGHEVLTVSAQFITKLKPGVELNPQDDVASLEMYDLRTHDGSELIKPTTRRTIIYLRQYLGLETH